MNKDFEECLNSIEKSVKINKHYAAGTTLGVILGTKITIEHIASYEAEHGEEAMEQMVKGMADTLHAVFGTPHS